MKGKAIPSSPDLTAGERLPPRVSLPRPIRDLGPVDIAALLKQVLTVSDRTWALEDEVKENDFAVFRQTQHMVFRFMTGNVDPRDFHDNPAWHIWKPMLMHVIDQAIAPYGFRRPIFPKVMFARLRARGEINAHVDGGAANLRTHKIHVPLVTNPNVTMSLGASEHHLEVGRAYEVNNVILHGVRNGGDADRIHFIFEVFDAAA